NTTMNLNFGLTAETLRQVNDAAVALGAAKKGGTLKMALDSTAISSSGLTTLGPIGVDLEPGVKFLAPLQADFVKSIPRKLRPGSRAIDWKDVTSVSMPKASATARTSGQKWTATFNARNAAFKHAVALLGDLDRQMIADSQGYEPALNFETSKTLL